jgi:hypothetical protein
MLKFTISYRAICVALLIATTTTTINAQKNPKGTPADFQVLRTDRITAYVPSGLGVNQSRTTQTGQMNCSIMGVGNMAQMNCNSSSTSSTSPAGVRMVARVYQLALLFASNNVGYIVSCPRVLFASCEPLTAAQSIHGFIESGNLNLEVGGKTRSYAVVTSAYIGPSAQNTGTAASTPTLIRATDATSLPPVEAAQSPKPDSTSAVAFTSDPTGADIYIDEKFVGNTPSTIQLSPGEHAVRIESSGRKVWTRTLTVTPGNKSTVQATLPPGA